MIALTYLELPKIASAFIILMLSIRFVKFVDDS